MVVTDYRIRVRGVGSLNFCCIPPDNDMVWLFNDDTGDVLWTGTPTELIELVMLGMIHKAELMAVDKKEPVRTHKLILCNLCGKPTTGQNPHYDCTQQEAYMSEHRG